MVLGRAGRSESNRCHIERGSVKQPASTALMVREGGSSAASSLPSQQPPHEVRAQTVDPLEGLGRARQKLLRTVIGRLELCILSLSLRPRSATVRGWWA